jgi:hypothetical protein
MFKLPFGASPGHWGLKGTTRDIAKAEYELEGYELDMRLLEIKKDDFTEADYERKIAETKNKHKKYANEVEYLTALANLIKDEKQRALALLEIDVDSGKIGEIEYMKNVATINDEPWVTVINMDFSKGTSLEGSFELDWNERFVEKLRAEGYTGPNSETIVNHWFMELCRNVAMEEFDGTGDFTADSEANLETYKRWTTKDQPAPAGRKGYT